MQLTSTTHALDLRASADAAWSMARYHYADHGHGIGIAQDAFAVAARSTDRRVVALAREAVVNAVKAQLTWGTTAVQPWYSVAGAPQRAAEVQEAVAPAYAGRRMREHLVPADTQDQMLHTEGFRRPSWYGWEWFDAMASCARHAASLAAASDGVSARTHALRAARAGIAVLSPQFPGASRVAAVEGFTALFDAIVGRTDTASRDLLRAADAFGRVRDGFRRPQ